MCSLPNVANFSPGENQYFLLIVWKSLVVWLALVHCIFSWSSKEAQKYLGPNEEQREDATPTPGDTPTNAESRMLDRDSSVFGKILHAASSYGEYRQCPNFVSALFPPLFLSLSLPLPLPPLSLFMFVYLRISPSICLLVHLAVLLSDYSHIKGAQSFVQSMCNVRQFGRAKYSSTVDNDCHGHASYQASYNCIILVYILEIKTIRTCM